MKDNGNVVLVPNKDTDSIRVVEVKHGLKIDIREDVLKQLQNNIYIQNNFQLNIKRRNRWWFSVYFQGICKSNIEYSKCSSREYGYECNTCVNYFSN